MSDHQPPQHDCCSGDADETPTTGTSDNRSSLWTGAGAVAAAVGASACCWLPLLAVGLGLSLSLGGAIGFFEAGRPYLLAAAVIFLAAGFYLVYIRKARCDPGSACATEPSTRKPGRVTQTALWFSTAVVIAMALFPYYSGALLGGSSAAPPPASANASSAGVAAENENQPTWVYEVDGMTCSGCEAAVCHALRQVPGIKQCGASYEEESAWITVAENRPDRQSVAKAIQDVGFTATPVTDRSR